MTDFVPAAPQLWTYDALSFLLTAPGAGVRCCCPDLPVARGRHHRHRLWHRHPAASLGAGLPAGDIDRHRSGRGDPAAGAGQA